LRPSLQAINATVFAWYIGETWLADEPRLPKCAALVAGTRLCVHRVNQVRLPAAAYWWGSAVCTHQSFVNGTDP
jgi:hypothetical protein